MKDVAVIIAELEKLGDPKIKQVYAKHGATGSFFGVKIGDLKKIQKRYKKNHELAVALFETQNQDAQYLAGLIADPKVITKDKLNQWIELCESTIVLEYMVAGVAAESMFGWELGQEWIHQEKDMIRATGWSTLANWVSIRPDSDLDLASLKDLLERIEQEISLAPNRTRYCMNGFIISLGSYVTPMHQASLEMASQVGKVHVDMGETACKVPDATAYLRKVAEMGKLGQKRKSARC